MSSPGPLERLCARAGVQTAGPQGPVPEWTLRAILNALGVQAGDAEIERRSLAQWLDREWTPILPPVAVAWDDSPALVVPLALPDDLGPEPLYWTIAEECGGERDGRLVPNRTGGCERRTIAGRGWTRRPIALPRPGAPGRHRLGLARSPDGPALASTAVLVAPRRLWQPLSLAGGARHWGLAARLGGLRSARNWGIGDFTDLARALELSADWGAGALAIEPLHAQFPLEPWRCDPHAPSSRRFLDWLHLDLESIPELADCPQAQAELAQEPVRARLRALRRDPLVDRAGVAELKLAILWRLFRRFSESDPDGLGQRGAAFRAYRDAQGEALGRFALFEAIGEHLAGLEGGPVPRGSWPAQYRRPDSPESAALARELHSRVDFHAWLQWLASEQLASAGRRALALHLALGLCQGLAAGAAPDGAEVWSDPELFAEGLCQGEPPGARFPQGLDLGICPWRPEPLREAAYEPLCAVLGAAMAQAGVLRIGGLESLLCPYLIPLGAAPDQGARLVYPREEMLAALALECLRNRCALVADAAELGAPGGPDPPLGLLADRVLGRERDPEGGFLAPALLPPESVVSAGGAQLPTLAGLWRGTDLELRRTLGLFAEGEYERVLVGRSDDRARLLLALAQEGLLPAGEGGADPVAVPELKPEHIRAVYRYLARSPCRLLLVETADLQGETEQAALPGSGGAYPSWRRREPLELERWAEDPVISALVGAIGQERGRSAPEPIGPAPGSEPKSERGANQSSPALPGPGSARIPRASYRLQLHGGFGFGAAADLVPYLAALGIDHCHCSPYLKARPGSTHGYDVVDHGRLNPELGTEEAFMRLCATLAAHGMHQILDMVPNHLGIMGGENRWWLDVLENGQASAYADFFDIDWEPLRQGLQGKVLVPVLGDRYGNVLDRGELKLVFAEGAFRVDYYEHRFPIDPREYPRILAPNLARLRERLGDGAPELAAFESLIAAFANLPGRDRLDAESLAERRRDKELHKERLAAAVAGNADLAQYLSDCLKGLNGDSDFQADPGRLHALLEVQAYRLAHWRVAGEEINYRRFFDINHLAALRMENPETFEATHALVLKLIAEGRVAGLRVDHPDGLYDPAEYFRRIQQRVAERSQLGQGVGQGASQGCVGPGGSPRPLYLVVEKILVGDERLPADWPVHGTTGYEVAAAIDGLFVDPGGEEPLTRCWEAFAGPATPLAEEVCAAKRLAMDTLLASELQVLAAELSRIAESDPHTRDFTPLALRNALLEVVACFPVYRTYISPEGVSTRDRNAVLKAVALARRRSRLADPSVFAFVQDAILGDLAAGRSAAEQGRVLHLAMKLQQYTGPVMAKGLEDTAYYRYNRLVSRNEVGASPERLGGTVEAFHRAMIHRREAWPHGLVAGSTHDSKRSEDLRARLHLLSELPGEWQAHAERWARINRRLKRESDGTALPDANTEYLLYQTLLGVWPTAGVDAELAPEVLGTLRARVGAYLEKAAREAKVHTAWIRTDPEYESALAAFVDAVLDPQRNGAFFDDFLPFLGRIAHLGLYTSLSATLLRLTVPGVPDLYQGSELLAFNLVDPDNRRPVDFELRRALLAELEQADAEGRPAQVWPPDPADPGRAKLALIRRGLGLRRADPELFALGDYRPLPVTGTHAERLCAFARTVGGRALVALAPRLLAPLVPPEADQWGADPMADPGWESTWVEVPGPVLVDALAGRELRAERAGDAFGIAAAVALRPFPVGLLSCAHTPAEPTVPV